MIATIRYPIPLTHPRYEIEDSLDEGLFPLKGEVCWFDKDLRGADIGIEIPDHTPVLEIVFMVMQIFRGFSVPSGMLMKIEDQEYSIT